MRCWSLLWLPGCLVNTSLYEERQADLEAVCDEVEVWVDDDGDGWGAGEPVLACGPGAGQVRNDRDCDDADDQITGRVGLYCPGDFAATPLAVQVASVELLVTVDGDPGLYPAAAEDRCVAWGGGLAVLSNPVRASAVVALLPDGWLGHTAATGGLWPDDTEAGPRCAGDPGPPGDDLLTDEGCFVTEAVSERLDPEVVCQRDVPDPADWEPEP